MKQVKNCPDLAGYVQLGWSEDLKKWSLTVSVWIKPSEWDFQECAPKTEAAVAVLYKHEDGSFYVAKSYEEQVAVHEKYGVPVVAPGEWFNRREVLRCE